MTALTLRNVKGSPLTNDEIDANFVSLNVNKVERGANLSDLADAATCRSNLGLVIGAQVQAFNADLSAIASLSGPTGLLRKTAANTWSLDTTQYPFPSGTRMLFAQAAAPVGWTQDTSDAANNRMLRVITGAGGGVAGSHDPTYCNVVAAHTHGFSTGYASADHAHYTSTGGASSDHSHGIGDPGHAHGVYDPGHSHTYERRPNSHTVGEGGSYWAGISQDAPATSHVGTGIGIHGAGTGIWTGGRNADHIHGGWSGGVNTNHTHAGSTDNGSSQTNWTPRYVNLILCTKD